MPANRATKVTMTAEMSNYISNMQAAAKATRDLGTEAEKLAAKREAFTALGTGMVAVGAVAAAAVGLAVAKFAEFDEAMSNVQAATQETTENMDLLRAAALEAGASTVFTATEAANAIEELGKNGLTTAQILSGGLSGALDLASAGQLGVARAAEIAAISMKQFNLEGKDLPHIADLLAAGAGKAAGDVEDLAQALNQAGLVAAQTGLSIEETTGVLAAFADAGLVGSDAGTSLKSALQRLTPISKESEKMMADLGISAYDTGGNFIGAAEFAGVLEDKLGHLTTQQRNAAMAQIFGSDAVRAASILYSQGADGIQRYIDQTNDSGYAAQVAADRLDNLRGDVEKLGGAFDTALIKGGSGANDSLRSLVQTVTGFVDVIGSTPAPVMNVVLALTGVVGVMGLVGGGALLAVPKIAAFRTALDALHVTGKSAALGIGSATLALTALTFALGAVASSQAKAANTASSLQDSLDPVTGAVTDYTRELIKKELLERGAFDGAARAGVSQRELTDAIIEGGAALDAVNDKIRDSGTFFDIGKGNTLNATRELTNGLADAEAGFSDLKNAGSDAEAATDDVSDAFDTASTVTDDYATHVEDLVAALRDYGATQFDVEKATDDYYASFDALTQLLAAGVGSLDQTTEAGRNTSSALLDSAASTNEYAASVLNAGGSTEEVQAILEAGRQKIIDTRIALGDTEEAARLYADQLVSTPEQIATAVALNGIEEATRKINRFISDNNGRRIEVLVDGVAGRRVAGSTLVDVARATGGILPGRPSSKDNLVVAAASGEFLVNAEQTARHRTLLESINDGTLPGYASGGHVAPTYMSAPNSGATSVSITVPVSVSAGLVSDKSALAKEVASVVRDAVRMGDLPQNWWER